MKIFDDTKNQLAISYASVMGIVLSLLGVSAYQFTAYDRQIAIDREIESVAGTIHDILEPKLVRLNRISPLVREAIHGLCLVDSPCNETPAMEHQIGVLGEGQYYLILLNSQGEVKAKSEEIPSGIDREIAVSTWSNLTDSKGQQYRQFSTKIHGVKHIVWGELRIGRNVDDLANSLQSLRELLLLGIPISLGIIGIASWYLAGRAMQPIYNSYQQIQEFTANVAHELRTPLATVQLTVEDYLTEYQNSDPQVAKILTDLHDQNIRLIQLVSDLLILAQIDRSSIKSSSDTCQLDELVEDLIEDLGALAAHSQITIEIEQPLAAVIVKGEPDRLARLVGNLIENAIKYTPVGGKVSVGIERTKTAIWLNVTDTGIGIPVAEQPKIFDRFYRVNSDRARQTGGTGLGLAIVKSIADLYGAKLQVKSQVGTGSTFTVEFPASDL
jgi:signal transduction histidine kinase